MKKGSILTIGLLLGAGVLMATQWMNKPKAKATEVKNVILLIGDGMGLSQITAGVYSSKEALALEKFPVVGLLKTHSSSSKITDSAAGATAYACGVKTYNGAIAVDADTQVVKTILEFAEDNQMRTGLIATCALTHATPASFYTHNHKRSYIGDSAITDFMQSGIEVFMGGGKNYFNQRKDSLNFYDSLSALGYCLLDSIIDELPKDCEQLVCLNAGTHPPSILDGRGPFFPMALEKGLQVLERGNEHGFFMMAEGAQIDWGGHENYSQYIVTEMLDFDQGIAAALAFAEQDGETLVIVTADHETGGYSVNGHDVQADTLIGKFTTGYHTASMVPIFAYGPGAEKFSGIHENTSVFHHIKALLKL